MTTTSDHKDAQARPDASMSLITDLFRQPVDEGYAAAAARRAESGEPRPRRWWLPLLTVVLAGGLLAAAVVQVRDNADVFSTEREELLDRVAQADAQSDDLTSEIAALEAEIDTLQGNALEIESAGSAQAAELERVRVLSGTSPVTGPGILVRITNSPDGDPTPDDGFDDSLVTDLDMRQVVNGLWGAGAEAISINGERITSLSAIRSANDVVLINYRPIASPYEVQAIGDADSLAVDFGDGPGGEWLEQLTTYGIDYGIFNQDDLGLPAATGVELRFAQEEQK